MKSGSKSNTDQESINTKLTEIFRQWSEEVLPEVIDKYSNNNYSRPFFSSYIEVNESDCKRVLIVGQEANNYGVIEDEISIEDSQKWVRSFVKAQCLGGNEERIPILKSPFWTFNRNIAKDYNILWTNLDKLHKYESGKTRSLSYDEEMMLHKPFGESNLTILQYEIEIFKPDIILFTVGPHYKRSLLKSLQIEESLLDKYSLSKSCPIVELTDIVFATKVFWTYHPKHLQMIKEMNVVIERIKNPDGS